MEKEMRARVQVAQLPLREKSYEMNFVDDAKLFRQLLEMALQRPFAGNDQLRVRILFLENGEGAERSRDAFLLNQPACLHQAPPSIHRCLTPDKGELLQRNAGAADAQLFLRATKRHEPFRERL